MKYLSILIIFLLPTIVVVNRCSSDSKEKEILPDKKGYPGDVTVVMDQDLIDGKLGQIVQDTLGGPVLTLVKRQSTFDLTIYNPEDFSKSGKMDRNIVVFNVDGGEEEKVSFQKEGPWAEGQLFILVQAKSKERLVELTQNNISKIKDRINKRELQRSRIKLKQNKNKTIENQLAKMLGLKLHVPRGEMQLLEVDREFAWLKRDRTRVKHNYKNVVEQGILVYHYPYTDTAQFQRENLIKARNKYLKEYVPGPKDSVPTFMSTIADTLFMTTAKKFTLNGNYAVELAGQWRITNDRGDTYGMGGPFLSVSVHDKKYNRIVTVEGYMLGPEFPMREYMREIRAILYSLKVGV